MHFSRHVETCVFRMRINAKHPRRCVVGPQIAVGRRGIEIDAVAELEHDRLVALAVEAHLAVQNQGELLTAVRITIRTVARGCHIYDARKIVLLR